MNWNNNPVTHTETLFGNRIKNAIHAKVRRRRFATLEHLSTKQGLHYADIHKRNTEALYLTLLKWNCNLVITSSCSLVPLTALPYLSHGAINMHPSWLPEYRGGEPILWHIIDGKETLATTIHRLTDRYDDGPILAQKRAARPQAYTKSELTLITDVVLGRQLLSEVIEALTDNPSMPGTTQPQTSLTRYARAEIVSSLAENYPIDSFSAQTLWDIIHYYGFCPPQWLDLSSW